MSGIILAAFAGLLTQQALPHPSTQELYTAPVIRPFEPGSDFGREISEGDGSAAPHRRRLTRPVTVDATAPGATRFVFQNRGVPRTFHLRYSYAFGG